MPSHRPDLDWLDPSPHEFNTATNKYWVWTDPHWTQEWHDLPFGLKLSICYKTGPTPTFFHISVVDRRDWPARLYMYGEPINESSKTNIIMDALDLIDQHVENP